MPLLNFAHSKVSKFATSQTFGLAWINYFTRNYSSSAVSVYYTESSLVRVLTSTFFLQKHSSPKQRKRREQVNVCSGRRIGSRTNFPARAFISLIDGQLNRYTYETVSSLFVS
jgi:hypothetical protein